MLTLAAVHAGGDLATAAVPDLLVGWLWYVGMLLPVIGRCSLAPSPRPIGSSYLPQIGLSIALVWTVASFGEKRAGETRKPGDQEPGESQMTAESPRLRVSRSSAICCRVAAASVVAILAIAAWQQTGHRRDSEAAPDPHRGRSPENTLALNNLGFLSAERGQIDAAIGLYQGRCARPDFASSAQHWATWRWPQRDGATRPCGITKGLEIRPDFAEAHNNLGIALRSADGQTRPSLISGRPQN